MAYRWILFDADGTLFDYDRAEDSALRELWRRAGIPRSAALLDTYRRVNSALWKQFEAGEVTAAEIKTERFARLLRELDLDGEPESLSADYLECLGRQTDLLPGADELLDSLAGGHRLALITNGLASVQRSRLERSPIGARFDAVVISEEVGFAKPDPRIFEAAFEIMGEPPKTEVLMVGDNLMADIAGAKRFGLATCWFNLDGRAESDGVGPTFEIQRLAQLLPVLEKEHPPWRESDC